LDTTCNNRDISQLKNQENKQPYDERELLEGIAEGDETAFEQNAPERVSVPARVDSTVRGGWD